MNQSPAAPAPITTTPAPRSPDPSKEALAAYLRDNDWEKELNHKMWITKAARFCAAKRLAAKSDASNKAQTFLSAYLIILGLVPVFLPSVNQVYSPELVGISTVGISILLLVYNQIEAARNYQLRAHLFHDCALRIGRLYNALRQAKMMEDREAKTAELSRITKKYERVLASCENHEDIDLSVAQNQKAAFFGLSWWTRQWIPMRSYCHAKLAYHLFIIAPPIVIALLYWWGAASPAKVSP